MQKGLNFFFSAFGHAYFVENSMTLSRLMEILLRKLFWSDYILNFNSMLRQCILMACYCAHQKFIMCKMI